MLSVFQKPSLLFIFIFLVFSLMYLSNTFKLWVHPEAYYKETFENLNKQPANYPFKGFLLARLENRKRWEAEQKIFSLLGSIAVVIANFMIVQAYLQ